MNYLKFFFVFGFCMVPVVTLAEHAELKQLEDIQSAAEKKMNAIEFVTGQPNRISGELALKYVTESDPSIAELAINAFNKKWNGGTEDLKIKTITFNTAGLWSTLHPWTAQPYWFMAEKFNTIKEAYPHASSTDIENRMKWRAWLEESQQIATEINQVPRAERDSIIARLLIANRRSNGELMPSELWNLVLERKEDETALRNEINAFNRRCSRDGYIVSPILREWSNTLSAKTKSNKWVQDFKNLEQDNVLLQIIPSRSKSFLDELINSGIIQNNEFKQALKKFLVTYRPIR